MPGAAVQADDIIRCDPTTHIVTRYTRSDDPVKSGATTDPNALIASLPASSVNPWNGVVPAVAQRYWKCSGNQVVEMTQAEKDAVDAPAVAEAAKQQAFSDEIAANDLCTGELTDFNARIEAERIAIQTQIDGASNVAGLKTAMTTMNTKIAAALKKLAKCVRARAR